MREDCESVERQRRSDRATRNWRRVLQRVETAGWLWTVTKKREAEALRAAIDALTKSPFAAAAFEPSIIHLRMSLSTVDREAVIH